MKIFLKQRILTFIMLPFVIVGIFYFYQKNKSSSVYATDPLVITYNGKTPTSPMFNVTNLIPGDVVEKTFNVKNSGRNTENIKMDAQKIFETKSFTDILEVQVTDVASTTVLFSGKLKEFFDLPPIALGSFSSGSNKNYKVKIIFPLPAGDQYQEAIVKFNVIWSADKVNLPTPTQKPGKDKDKDKKNH